MSGISEGAPESRRRPRLTLPPMYTFVRVRPAGTRRYCWSGHVYDISETGMRFELDRALEPGTKVEARAMLPGHRHVIVHATGHVVRLHDDTNEAGPMRMGMVFETFSREIDRQRLSEYLATTKMAA